MNLLLFFLGLITFLPSNSHGHPSIGDIVFSSNYLDKICKKVSNQLYVPFKQFQKYLKEVAKQYNKLLKELSNIITSTTTLLLQLSGEKYKHYNPKLMSTNGNINIILEGKYSSDLDSSQRP